MDRDRPRPTAVRSEPRAVTLDLWHTLVYLAPSDEEAYMRAQVALAADALGSSPTRPGASRSTRAENRKAFADEYHRAVQFAERGRSVPPRAQIERAARRVGRRIDTESYLEALGELVGRNPFRAAPDALRTLDRLRAGGFRTAVISNTVGEPGRSLLPLLDRMGFASRVGAWIFSDERPWAKPSASIFRDALREVRVRPGRTIHVGDGWPDIEGARRARLRAGVLFTGLQSYGARYRRLFLRAGWHRPASGYRIDRLEALVELAERLVPREPE